MADIALISCVKTKNDFRTRSLELYKSPLFKKSLLHALQNNRKPLVLSAKHGLLSPDDQIDPYELTLKTFSQKEKAQWAKTVVRKLKKVVKKNDRLFLYAGSDYANSLLPLLAKEKIAVFQVLQGSLGSRLSQLRKLNLEDEIEKAFHEIVKLNNILIGGNNQGRRLSELSEFSKKLPHRGIYIFIDENEKSKFNSFGRIVRVGTHAVSMGAKSSLNNRLRTHRGSEDKRGSHRSSIFRLHVGNALKKKHPNKWKTPNWGVGSTAEKSIREKEQSLEMSVSKYIGELRFLWLNIPDEAGPKSDRAFIERQLIGILSSYNILKNRNFRPWLGLKSTDHRISLSGLWNLNHLYCKPHKDFVDVYKKYVEFSVSSGDNISIVDSIAPKRWHDEEQENFKKNQLELFSE